MVGPHQPVLLREAVGYLVTNPDGLYVDGTVGPGGHSEAIGQRLSQSGSLICLDKDPDALALCRERLAFMGRRVRMIQGSFTSMEDVLSRLGHEKVHGILLDLGLSSAQLERSGRGFSFLREEPLDMRMDPTQGPTAAELINQGTQKELEAILRQYGEERRARAISRAIVEARRRGHIRTSSQLAALVESLIAPSSRSRRRHPATRTFQALRIAVNRELEELEAFLEIAPRLLIQGGRLVVLSYHSLEDRMVKRAMVSWEKGCECPPHFPRCICGKLPLCRRLTKKGIKPDPEEIAANPRARSAILRAAERV